GPPHPRPAVRLATITSHKPEQSVRTVMIILQAAAALGLLNVWLLRSSKPTAYRGGNAGSMAEEFAAYGLPAWFAYVIGALKIGAALALLVGIWIPSLVLPAAALICILMLGALAMHIKVGDPLGKSLPALGMLVICLAICWGALRWMPVRVS
ncbi:MAG TPA: DoxX family protein, partial [Longimicrobium sp.]|nr:DoxX family protein [Longimicrobium sp.]